LSIQPSSRTGVLQLAHPLVPEEAVQAAAETLRSGWLGPGPRTAQFEREFAEYIGASYCVALDSGTSAMHLALRVLDLPRDAEVVTTANTYVATNFAILYVGARPVFADIDPATGTLDPASVEARITDRTAAIIAVDYAGYPCDFDALTNIAYRAGVPLVEDCASACGAKYGGRRVGTHANLHAFSFSPVKNLASVRGGAITLGSKRWCDRLRRLSTMGIDRDDRGRAKQTGGNYDISELGFRAAMDDVTAAIALVQLKRLDVDNRRRSEIANHYSERLRGVSGLTLLRRDLEREGSNLLFPTLVENRDGLMDKLAGAGVETTVHFRRNDRYPMFSSSDLPNTEWFWRHELSLPLHLRLTDNDVEYVCDVIAAGW
jgi:perosamine synthetase